ncbi:winged helix-turn-helix domain-containing protein [Veronia nyctiphanis]|uniref:winged helix-turn-helix domain-containing protein n=1 Tax=Veronia nyctiphanis TaxID=1278244 RepID=UPI001F23CBE2|nr:hypothetical protein [Veronia nyctiphanis]
MTTKVNSRCYRFSGVVFEPESRSLIWTDSSVTNLSYEECRLLEMLCHHAGEVISSRVLFASTTLSDASYSQHQNTLCSLLGKSYRDGEKVLPLDMVGDFGYRVSLPQRTYQKNQTPAEISDEQAESVDLALAAPQEDEEQTPNIFGRASAVVMCVGIFGFLLYTLHTI